MGVHHRFRPRVEPALDLVDEYTLLVLVFHGSQNAFILEGLVVSMSFAISADERRFLRTIDLKPFIGPGKQFGKDQCRNNFLSH